MYIVMFSNFIIKIEKIHFKISLLTSWSARGKKKYSENDDSMSKGHRSQIKGISNTQVWDNFSRIRTENKY